METSEFYRKTLFDNDFFWTAQNITIAGIASIVIIMIAVICVRNCWKAKKREDAEIC